MAFYNLLGQLETLLMVLTLLVGIGLSGFAMQRGRPALLPMLAFAIGLVGLLSSWAAVTYARSGGVGSDARFLVMAVGNLARTLGFIVSQGLIYMALFGRQAPPLP
jgi:hypothetical protein